MDIFNANKYLEDSNTTSYIESAQFDRLKSLVLNINSDLKNEVTAAKEKYNLKIRSVISEKTGLSLTRKSEILHKSKDRNTVPIKIEDRIPLSLARLCEKYSTDMIELLLHYHKMKIAIRELEFQYNNYSKFIEHHKNITDSNYLKNTIDYLYTLIRSVESCNILNEIKQLGPDVLGAYFFRHTNHYEYAEKNFVNSRIELYWLSIGFCSLLYGVSVEEFTIVVMIHELVHAYTHCGYDKDGNIWLTDDFRNTDLRIVEGFAQQYTEFLCKDYFENSSNAFKLLLTDQAEEYTKYKEWRLDEEKNKFEKVRKILIDVRKLNIRSYDKFENLLF